MVKSAFISSSISWLLVTVIWDVNCSDRKINYFHSINQKEIICLSASCPTEYNIVIVIDSLVPSIIQFHNR